MNCSGCVGWSDCGSHCNSPVNAVVRGGLPPTVFVVFLRGKPLRTGCCALRNRVPDLLLYEGACPRLCLWSFSGASPFAQDVVRYADRVPDLLLYEGAPDCVCGLSQG